MPKFHSILILLSIGGVLSTENDTISSSEAPENDEKPFFGPWPEPWDREAILRSYGWIRRKYGCAHNWSVEYEEKITPENLYAFCGPNDTYNNSGTITYLINDQQKGIIRWTMVEAYLRYIVNTYCYEECGFFGFWGFYGDQIHFMWERAKAMANDSYCYFDYTLSYCNWWAYLIDFRYAFAYFTFPATLLCSYINLSTLQKMMGKKPGPALYLHQAEVISCGIFNIFVGIIDCLAFFETLDSWRGICALGKQYVSFFQTGFVTLQYLRFQHQCFLTALVGDRLYGLARPMVYGQGDLKKRGRNMVVAIIVFSFIFYLPLLALYFFSPIFMWWRDSKSIDVIFSFDAIDTVLSIISIGAICSLLVIQIVCGAMVENLFRKFISSSMSRSKDKRQQKRAERDKRLLLIGTIGLNIITGVLNNALMMLRNTVFQDIFDLHMDSIWQVHLIAIFDPILNFINGNGSVFIHIWLVKSYRVAFSKTWLGREVFRLHIQAETTMPASQLSGNSAAPSRSPSIAASAVNNAVVDSKAANSPKPSVSNNYIVGAV